MAKRYKQHCVTQSGNTPDVDVIAAVAVRDVGAKVRHLSNQHVLAAHEVLFNMTHLSNRQTNTPQQADNHAPHQTRGSRWWRGVRAPADCTCTCLCHSIKTRKPVNMGEDRTPSQQLPQMSHAASRWQLGGQSGDVELAPACARWRWRPISAAPHCCAG